MCVCACAGRREREGHDRDRVRRIISEEERVRKWDCFPWNRCWREVSHSYHGDPVCRITLRAITQPPTVLWHTNLHSHTSTRWDFEWQLCCCSLLPRRSSPHPSVPDWPPDVWGSRLTKSCPLNTKEEEKNKVEISVSILRQFKRLRTLCAFKTLEQRRSNELDSSVGESAEHNTQF